MLIWKQKNNLLQFIHIYTITVLDVNISTYMINRKLYKTNDKKFNIANAFAEDIHHSLESGMNAHIVKPIDLKELYEVKEGF